MRFSTRHRATAAYLLAALVPALASQRSAQELPETKEAIHERMSVLEREIEALRFLAADPAAVQALERERALLSAALGGDQPSPVHDGSAAGLPAGALAQVAVPPSCGLAPVLGNFSGTSGPIIPAALTYVPGTYTTVVSGVGAYLWDVNLRTAIVHPDNGELDITLTSPQGTTVVITTDNGSTLDNGFNGTLWDDEVNEPVTEYTFTNLVTATPVAPEGRLEAFRGQNPNGTWTLTIADDTTADVGALTSWSLEIRTLPVAPGSQTNSWTNTSGLPIPDGGSIVGKQLVTGQGTYLERVRVGVLIPHTESADLDLSLQGPSGTVVRLTTDNGGTFDNVFNGTLFDGRVTDTVTDHVFANLAAATPLSPEAPFDAFRGQDPNGIWTLIVTDDLTTDVGTFQVWSLELTSIPPPAPDGPLNFQGLGGPIPDFVSTATTTPSVFTTNVAGLPSSLWDVDLTTAIVHTSNGDIDMTLTSPAGTVVVITTDNGAALDNAYNGTLWDDSASAIVTDVTYVNLTTSTPLAPEGRLAAFRGENPNGTWTLTIVDDALADNGTLTSWSLGLAALGGPPGEVSTTLTRMPGLPIPDVTTTVDSFPVAGLGTSITEIELRVEILHTYTSDMDISLVSPAGTTVVISTDNGGGFDNNFNGTRFDADAPLTVTDVTYVNNVAPPLLSPEGPFDAFLGQDPNGTWRLQIVDDLGGDIGTLVRWDLTVRVCGLPPPYGFCFGDGTGTACPCANNGAAGNGCAHSLNANGAHLEGVGSPSIANDTLALIGSGMPNSNALYFQGGSQVGGGSGFLFGDGLRCAGSPVVRLATKLNVGGASQVPSAGDPPISIDGMNAAGNVRYYQVWYRNAAAFCTPDTFNLTNGVGLTWSP